MPEYILGNPEPLDFGAEDILEQLRRDRKKKLNIVDEDTLNPIMPDKMYNRQTFASALPFIAAALTAKDQGTASRIMTEAANILEQRRQNRSELKERERARAAELRERERERLFEDLGREDTQAHQEKLLEREIKADKESKRQEFEFDKEVEEIKNDYKEAQIQTGLEADKEIVTLNAANDMISAMTSMGFENARDLAYGAFGVEDEQLDDIEKEQLKLFANLSRSQSGEGQHRVLLDYLLKIDNMTVDVLDEEGNKIIDPITKEPKERKLSPRERLEFLSDPIEFFATYGLPETDPGNTPTDSGETVDEIQKQSKYREGLEIKNKDSVDGRILRSIETQIDKAKNLNEDGAKNIVSQLYEEYGNYEYVKGIIDSYQIDDRKKLLLQDQLDEVAGSPIDRFSKGISSGISSIFK